MSSSRLSPEKIIQPIRVLITIGVLCILGTISYVLHQTIIQYIPFDKWFLLDPSVAQTLLEYMWSVQGTVSAISVALLALFSGLTKERIFGIRQLEYISSNRPESRFGINVWDESAIIILLTGASFIFVAKTMVAASIYIFVITFLLIFDLLSRTVWFFVGEPEDTVRELLINSVLAQIAEENGRQNS